MPDKETHMPWEATRRALAGELAAIDGVLPGSVVLRQMRCGKPGCACKHDPPTLHGPYIQWTRTVDGKTVTRYLTQDQLGRYQQWFDNARRLREIVAKLEIASLHAVEQFEAASTSTADASTPSGSRRRPPRQRPA
ncbi:MAG: hypothetical protein M0Z40_08620 [Actinomycetota bacterium]|jgi:hypothetical protein|nr:hypothetical protein [Actinomycetota bacterium]MDA8075278.1 hypothetical protein [Actinomycetota bacterium]